MRAYWLAVPVLAVAMYAGLHDARDPAAFTAWARAGALPFDLTDSAAARASLRPLTNALTSSKLIGLGESTHGSHEFAQIRVWMIQNLADSGLTDVIFEAPLPNALRIDAYVQGAAGDPDALLHGLGFWMDEDVAVRELVVWLRSWNLRGGHQRIHFRGIDNTYPGTALDCLREYAGRASIAVTLPDSTANPWLYARTRSASLRGYSEGGPDAFRSSRRALVSAMQSIDASPVAANDADAAIARRCLEVAMQAHVRYGTGNNVSFRDSTMALNALWWLGQTGTTAKGVVWAQNGHVAAAWERDRYIMGTELRRALGAAYSPVAFLFDRGAVLTRMREANDPFRERLPSPSPLQIVAAKTPLIEAYLRETGLPAFGLDLRNPSKPAGVSTFLSAPVLSRDIGDFVMVGEEGSWPYVFGRAFDAIVFIDSTGPIRLTALGKTSR